MQLTFHDEGPENPSYIKLENTWIVLNCGGGLTPDKPEVFLETPSDLNRVNSFLNLRVADIPTATSSRSVNIPNSS